MLYKLTEHYLITKNQNLYLKGLKASLKPNECIIILDFAENFSFVVQDAAQAFHWSNAQATIHLFVVYHKSNNGDLCHRAFACISDHMTHNTIAVYLFLEKLITDYVKLSSPTSENSLPQWRIMCPIQKLQKLCKSDFSCTRFWYYSRVELICNFPGKNSCDGAGGTVKRLVTRASLQRPLDSQILTPYQLFEFASQNISGITSFYVDASLFLKGVAWRWFVFLGVPPMLATISLIPTEWILTISHLVHIMLANMTATCISVLWIMFPWNMVKFMHPKAPSKKGFFWSSSKISLN